MSCMSSPSRQSVTSSAIIPSLLCCSSMPKTGAPASRTSACSQTRQDTTWVARTGPDRTEPDQTWIEAARLNFAAEGNG